MTTQIIEPTSSIYNLQLEIPIEFIGKKVVINFEQMEVIEEPRIEPTSKFISSDIFKDCRVSLKEFKFNRDEANDYDDFFEKSKIDFKKDIDAFYDNIQIDMSNFKFNRDEANER